MALKLRLITTVALSFAFTHTDAQLVQTVGLNAGNWAPVTPTKSATSNPEGWLPKTTPPPDRRPADWELRRRVDSNSSTCGYPVDNLNAPAAVCDEGICMFNRRSGVVGCCTNTDPGGCVIPTACLNSTNSVPSTANALTTYCGNKNFPHCVTYPYSASFFDSLYGASFVGCAAEAATEEIATTPAPGWTPPGGTQSDSTTVSRSTIGGSTITETVTISPGSSLTITPSSSNGNSHAKRVGEIAGGTVGGVAAVALIGAAIGFLLYRRRKQQRARNEFSPPLGRRMPPNDLYPNVNYPNEEIPGSQYPSTFYGEAPPGMAQTSDQPVLSYPPNTYGTTNNGATNGYGALNSYGAADATFQAEHNRNALADEPSYFPMAVTTHPKHQFEAVSPIEPSPVSPVSPAENYNTMVSTLSNPSPPLQPLSPSHRQSNRSDREYSQYSPPPPEQFQSFHPYPGT
ncbi:hypothetical protein F5Y16DRAFT_399962 [Xylariaceae sp. FL0255]|nr:hypothetical protein F5Y16DRAFT_399962 [Xylariaceae sp. FL0255]